jgi:MFS family permease
VASTTPPTTLVSRGFLVLCVATFACFVGVGVTIPVLPRFISSDLGLGDLAVGTAVGIFAVGALGVRPWAGRWGDAVGRKPLLLWGLLLTAAPTALTGVSEAFTVLLALRVVTGVGQALFFVGGATLAADLAPEGRRGAALSLFSLPIYVGLGVGPALGEYLYRSHGATVAFLVAGSLPALALALWPVLPERLADAHAPVDRPRGPLLHPVALGPGTVILLGLLGFIGFQAYLPLYADEIGLLRPEFVFLLYASVVILVRTAGAGIPDRLGAGRTGTLAASGITLGLGLVAAVPRPSAVYVGAVVLGVGMALQYPALMSLAVGRAPEHERARVVSTFSGFFDLAQAGGGAVLGLLAVGFGYRGAFAGGAVAALISLIVLRLRVARSGADGEVRSEPEAWAPPGAE